MSETKVVRVASIKEFVRRVSTKGPEDIEKLLVHLLDNAQIHWNDKATQYLRDLKSPDLSEDQLRALKRDYDTAFRNAQALLRMRHGVSIVKVRYSGS
jgi:hypothetical protein